MAWSLAILAVTVLGVAAISRRLSGTPVTPAMVFVAVGLLVGPEVLGEVDLSSSGATVRTLAEATLALVLFSDASRIDLRLLRREVGVPVRLLGIGLPLTIALGALAAAVVSTRTRTNAITTPWPRRSRPARSPPRPVSEPITACSLARSDMTQRTESRLRREGDGGGWCSGGA